MAWLGVPFPLVGDEAFYYAEVFLNKIPKIIVELPSKGWSIEGFLTALVAGGIPAIVAWLTLRSNVNSQKIQISQQERLTRMTLTAELVTSNRKKLIDDLRKCTSSYLSFVQSSANTYNKINYYEKNKQTETDRIEDLKKELTSCFHQMSVERWNIRLLISEKQPQYEPITKAITDITFMLNQPGLYPNGYTRDDFDSYFEAIENGVKSFIEEQLLQVENLV
ncbi:hypothetical protein OWK27_00930 [Enterobacter cloacae complex sp. 2022EL-00788]|uniref:hypothetical protein n=1 Tax=Enterobacter cloacae complex sp. 2022EL-00788 TaxID=2996512 RepID=UPI00226E1A94|nr:hypothetical protein [Enterobacter cloacae complex sp. 2022EL-00788]MCY0771279.1 hypothetical protein [Enterobacter cloacae complex sp. 2022EL-00788]